MAVLCVSGVLVLLLAQLAVTVARKTTNKLNGQGAFFPWGEVANAGLRWALSPTSGVTFRSFYDSHVNGRGVWKWQNALDAYQQHFGMLAGDPLALAEVGVGSGGSMLMWQSVLGPQIKLYGLDTNAETERFASPDVTIMIGDQADPATWAYIWKDTVDYLDILIDDGGHEPKQMLQTLISPFPHIRHGGYLCIEDIGANYLDSFFKPAADFLSRKAQTREVNSVHLYPFLLVVRKAGDPSAMPLSEFKLTGNATAVADIGTMWAAIHSHPGGQVVLRNPAWGSFLAAHTLENFFAMFNDLHSSNFVNVPAGCELKAAEACTTRISPLSEAQKLVTAIHIYDDSLVAEVASAPPVIQAVRRGSEWIGLGL